MTALPAPRPEGLRTELRTLARLALPIALAQSGLVAMGLVDVAIVGRLSVEDLAATSMGRSLVYMMSSLCFGVAAAIDPLAAQAIGAGNPGRAWAALRSTLRAGALVGFGAAAAAFAATLALAPMGVDPALVPRVRLYIAGQVPSFFLFPAFLAGKNFLQCFGETRPALVAAIVGNAVNFVVWDVRFPFLANVTAHWMIGLPLAIALAFGLDLGVRGLWLGLTAGLIVSAVLLALRFLRLSRGAVARVDAS